MINLRRCVVKISPKLHGTLARLVSSKRPTAGLVVVGDEILKAQVKEINSFYACNLLYEHGVKVQKVSVVPDDVPNIAKEIKGFSKKFDYVFTSGGIGPTHDDVTYEAVALAFDDTLHYHPTLKDIVANRFGCKNFPSPSYKMACIPTKAELKFGVNEATGEKLPYPCIVMKNVFIFPGSPMFFKLSFRALCKELFTECSRFATAEVYVNASEESFAESLSNIAIVCPNVSFGSYPERNRYYKARITIESKSTEDTEAAKEMVCSLIPSNVLVYYDRAPHVDCVAKFEKLIEQSECQSIYKSSFKKFVDYYRESRAIWIYLDGSEESVIMIHLARVAVNKLRQNCEERLYAFYFKFDCTDYSMNGFFREISDRYGVELCSLQYDQSDAGSAIKYLIASRPKLQTLLLFGKRWKSNEREIYETLTRASKSLSANLLEPQCPLIDWKDKDVATFASSLSLPYYTAETQSVV